MQIPVSVIIPILKNYNNYLTEALNNSCNTYYYSKHTNLPNVNCLIPISKHYEESEAIFTKIEPIIKKYTFTHPTFNFQNFKTTDVYKKSQSAIKQIESRKEVIDSIVKNIQKFGF